jgi:AAA ATPase containing von Willebrand factor type A (vWA) domain
MVSYMYQYENGVKRRNVGFAKVEAKGGLCKFTLHMQLLGQLDSIFPTYLIQRNTNNLELVYLGDAVLRNQVMDSRLTAEENNIMGTGYKLSDMGGILLFLHDNIFFATEWDDKPVVAEEVLAALRPKNNKVKVVNDIGLQENPAGVKEEASQKETETAREPFLSQNPQKTSEDDSQASSNSKLAEVEISLTPVSEKILPELSLEEELKIPKYKLPGGYKMIERLQNPWETVMPAQVQEDAAVEAIAIEDGVKDNVGREDQTKKRESIQDYSADLKKIMNITTENLADPEEQFRNNREPDKIEPYYERHDITQDMDQTMDDSQTEETENEYKTGDNETEEESEAEDNVVEGEYESQDAVNEDDTEARDELMDSEEDMVPDPLTAQQILGNYPRIYPFEDNEVLLCVKIEPKDIGLLPKSIWPYSNNSFLMHGYYCYHHLIFAKMKLPRGSRYILGVPGIFHSREQFMAKMFGFENFKSMKNHELKQGDFGYWYLPVNFNE